MRWIELTIDVTELQKGDVIFLCSEFGPVKEHYSSLSFPDSEEIVVWESGGNDRFGKPQRLKVLRAKKF